MTIDDVIRDEELLKHITPLPWLEQPDRAYHNVYAKPKSYPNPLDVGKLSFIMQFGGIMGKDEYKANVEMALRAINSFPEYIQMIKAQHQRILELESELAKRTGVVA